MDKRRLGAGGVHCREFNIISVFAGVLYRIAGHLENLLAAFTQLIKQVDIRRRQDNVDTRIRRAFNSIPAIVNSLEISVGQDAYRRRANRLEDKPDSFKIPRGSDRETCFYNVNAP